MNGRAAQRAGLFIGLALLLGGCGHHSFNFSNDDTNGINTFPANYKTDILGAMHVYLNDPTGIRDAAIAAPALKQTGGETRYMVCVKFNPKKNDTEYAGVRELAAVFLGGRFDRFLENPKDQCAGATYTPFPELQKLPP